MPEPAVVVRGASSPVQRGLARALMPVVTLAGVAILWAAWGLAPWYVYGIGLAVTALGVWLQILVELSARESITVGFDGSLLIHSPALLAQDVRVGVGEIHTLAHTEPGSNHPVGETLLTLLGRGGHLRIELREPRVLAGARWTNHLWRLRAESDPFHIDPPLWRTRTAVLDFHCSPSDAAVVLRRFEELGRGRPQR